MFFYFLNEHTCMFDICKNRLAEAIQTNIHNLGFLKYKFNILAYRFHQLSPLESGFRASQIIIITFLVDVS